MNTKNVNITANTWTQVSALGCSISNPHRGGSDIFVAQASAQPSASLLGHRVEAAEIYNADGAANPVWVKSSKDVIIVVTEG